MEVEIGSTLLQDIQKGQLGDEKIQKIVVVYDNDLE
jgi:hypothetical protein